MRFLITGTAGFIGFHLARRLLQAGHVVAGVDNFSAYYDPALKEDRNAVLEGFEGYSVHRVDLADAPALNAAWDEAAPDVVVHLAAQAGVRYSIDQPDTYVASNLVGTFHVLEAPDPATAIVDYARKNQVDHVVMGARSSGGLRRYLGSVSTEVTSQAECSVTVVRAPARSK